MLNYLVISLTLVLLSSCTVAQRRSLPDGDNVCVRTEKVYPERDYYYTTKYVWCPETIRCLFHEKHYRTHSNARDVSVNHCCEGYRELDRKCVPDCAAGCVHGQCVAPDACTCDSDFWGAACDSDVEHYTLKSGSIATGVVAAVTLVAVGLYCVCRRRGRNFGDQEGDRGDSLISVEEYKFYQINNGPGTNNNSI